MKKNLKLLFYPVIFAGIFLFTINSCKKDSTKSSATCDQTDDGCGGTLKACCSSTQCYYVYGGQTYNCAGTDCTNAAGEVAAAILANCSKSTGSGAAITQDQINAKAKEILSETER